MAVAVGGPGKAPLTLRRCRSVCVSVNKLAAGSMHRAERV